MNLWILTEELPKKEVLKMIFEYFAKDQNCGFFGDSIRIIPILNKDKTFSFTYEVIGFKCAKVDKVFIKTVSGSSSFTDFLVFYQENLPTVKDTPLYAIEETKTDDKESRNTGVYQRCSNIYLKERGLKMNLWILTEELPKKEVLKMIFEYFAKDQNCGFFGDSIRIIPILNKDKTFSFTYEVIGFKCAKVDKVFIKTVSGSSSFTDFLVFYQENLPTVKDTPLYAIEETKTDDKESRNTGVYQRCSKFVFIQNYYPKTKLIMLYALQVGQKEKPTETYIFGTRLLLTLGVEILGKKLDPTIFKPFTSINELRIAKASMRPAPKGNIPILINIADENWIQVSGRLFKSGGLSHDPNIGALSIISAVIRKLGFEGKIEIIMHGLEQKHVGKTNKFVQIANVLGIELEGLTLPKATLPEDYWHYETKGEKLGTIFIHLVVENFTESYSIFENHAGGEKGYFVTKDGQHLALEKYADREAYKAGDKNQIIFIPDLVLLDIAETEVITIEGKKYEFKQNGIDELNSYDIFDERYLKPYYPEYKIIRTVVLYGSNNEQIAEIEVGFLLNEKGKLVLGIKAPKLFKRAISNLLDYWN